MIPYYMKLHQMPHTLLGCPAVRHTKGWLVTSVTDQTRSHATDVMAVHLLRCLISTQHTYKLSLSLAYSRGTVQLVESVHHTEVD